MIRLTLSCPRGMRGNAMATAPNSNRADKAPDPRAGRPKMLVFWGFLAPGALIAVVFLLYFPGLRSNPAYLALTTLTPIAIGLALGIQFSGLARRLPRLTVNGLRAVVAVLIALVLVVYAG